jgi:VCBS repeat-containing protein
MADGTSNADTFTAPSGNSNFNGLGGVDTIIFNFALTSANIQWVGNQVIIDTGTSHTVLTGFEIYQFTDGTVNNDDGNPLVDDLYYNWNYQDVWAAHVDADGHYSTFGWHEKRNPNAFFNTSIYLSLNQDVAASGGNPLEHFDLFGWKEGRNPSPDFDVHQYLVANPDVAAANIDPLSHFLLNGAQEGRVPFAAAPLVATNGFDYNYYLAHNPDVAAAGVDAFQHFQTFGWKEGRNPSAFFDVAGYLQTYPDVAAANVNPLDHYHDFGWSEGRNPSPLFDTAAYLAANPDVAAAHVDPLFHYLHFGIQEGRAAIPSAVTDTNAVANSIIEGAASGSAVGLTVSWGGWVSPALSYSLTGDTSGGGFTIDPTTGVVTVLDGTKLDFESATNHAYSITIQAQDGSQTKSQVFTISVADVAPTTPVDTNGAANTITEGDATGTLVGITASASDVNGPAIVYSLSDSAGGRFAIDPGTGVITVGPNANLINYETAVGHAYSITVAATAGGVSVSSQTFSIDVGDVGPGTPVDSDVGTDTVEEGATTGALVGVTIQAPDVNGGPLTYRFADLGGGVFGDAGGRFQINSVTGVVSVSATGAASIDYETASGHAYSITVEATDGLLTSVTQSFVIAVTNADPSAAIDNDGAEGGSIEEGAALGTAVGITALATDPGGTTIVYTLTDNAGGRFQIDSSTGVVSVGANGNLIDFETQPVGGYSITVQASDGQGGISTQSFAVAVTNANPSPPADINGAADSVTEGVGSGQATGVTFQATDPGGTTVTYALTDNAGGRFQIDTNSGVVTTGPNAALIDFETSGGSYNITVQASDGNGGLTSQTLAIAVADAPPGTFTDTNAAADTVVEDAANNTPVGVHANAIDPNGGTVTYSFATLADSANGAFKIDAATGVISVADHTKVDFESSGVTHSYDVLVTASTVGGTATSTHVYTINVTDVAPPQPDDTDTDANTVIEGATATTTVGITALSEDINGGAASYSLTNDAGGLFTIDSSSGVVSVTAAGATGIDFESSGGSYAIQVQASDGTLATTQNFTVTVTNAAPATPTDSDVTANTVSDTANDGDTVGVDLVSLDPNGGNVTFTLTDSAGGRFAIDASTGVVTVATGNPGFTSGTPYTIKVTATDSHLTSAEGSFVINGVTNNLSLDLDDDDSSGVTPTGYQDIFVEQGTAVAVADDDVTIANLNNPGANTIVSATIVLTNAQLTDVLAVNGGLPGGITSAITTSAGKITVTLTGSSTFANYQTALHQIVFSTSGDPGADAPNLTDRVVTVTVNDGSNNSQATSTIHITPVNDAPVLQSNSSPTVTFTENGISVAPLANGTIVDPDHPADFSGGTFTVAITGGASAGDQVVLLGGTLFATNGTQLLHDGNVVGTINGLGTATASVTGLTAAATPTVVDELARAFGFRTDSDDPSTSDRTLTYTVQDGGHTGGTAPGLSNVAPVTAVVHVSAVNDAPVNTVPFATQEITQNASNVAINGISFTDVDGGANETVQLSTSHGNLHVTAGGATISGGANDSHTLTLSGSIAAINAALATINYSPDSGYIGADTITVLTDDGGDTGSGGAKQDTDGVSIQVSPAIQAGVTSQLWYLTQLGPDGDNVVGHLNSDGGNIVHFSLGTDQMNDVGLDTSADLYFLIDSNGILTSYRPGGTTVLDSVQVGSGIDFVDAVAVDPAHNTIFVSVAGFLPDEIGIQKFTYDSAGALTAGDFLLSQASLTTGTVAQAVDLAIDLSNGLLYYVDDDLFSSNGIYVVNYTDGSDVATGLTDATLLTDETQFPGDGSEGSILAVTFDNRGTAATDDDIIYFLTSDILGGTNSLWYIVRGDTTANLVTNAPTLTEVGAHTGLSFDSATHQLYITNQDSGGNTDSIIQVQLDAAGTTVTGAPVEFNLTDLTGVATPDLGTVPAQTAIDMLPVLSVAANANFTETNPSNSTVILDNALTVADPESYLTGATVIITGSFAGSGDSTSVTLGSTNITVAGSVDAGGNTTLEFSGRDTAANYQEVLRSLGFISGDNPTNSGNNATRTVTWHLNDGAAGDPWTDGNTKVSTITVTAANDAPVLDLDANDSGANGATGLTGADFAVNYAVSGPAVAIADIDATIADADDTNIESATITLTNAKANDILAISGALPAGITLDPSSTATLIKLTGSASLAAYQTALQQIVFNNPLAAGTPAGDRTVTVVLSDGADNSNTATTTIHVTQDAAPVGTNDTSAITAGTATVSAIATANDTDAEDPSSALVISAVRTGAEADSGSAGTVGNALVGQYGTLTLNFDGTYTYDLDNNNAAVLAAGSANHLHDFFTYTVRDTAGLTDVAQIDIDITGQSDPPTANPDAVSATEAGGLANGTPGVDPTGNVITNDTDPDLDTLTVQGVAAGAQAGPLSGNVGGAGVVSASGYGTLTIQANGGYSYAVNNSNSSVQALRTSGQTLTDTFSYTINDGNGGTSTTQVTVTIHGQNDNPVAMDDQATVQEAGGTANGTAGSPAGVSNFNVLTGVGSGSVADTDPDSAGNGETQQVQGVTFGNVGTVLSTGVAAGITNTGSGLDFGTLTLNANGTYSYVVNQTNATVQALNNGQSVDDVFTYTMRDADGATDNATITIHVTGKNDAPVAIADGNGTTPFATVLQNRATSVTGVNLLTNDTDVDSPHGNLTAVKDTNTAHGGTVTVNSDGTFSVTYAAGTNYLGQDTFTYHGNDNDPTAPLASNSAIVTIDVAPKVWFIDKDSASATEDGSLANPFKSIGAFNAANAAAAAADRPDIVYLEYGNSGGTGVYSSADGINLTNGQTLLGSGVDLTYQTSASAPGGPATILLLDVDNTKVSTIQITGGAGNQAVQLAQNNTLRGFNIDTTNADGIGIEDSNGAGAAGSVGTLTVSGVSISGVGKAIDIDQGGTLAANFTSITSTGSNSEGIQLGGIAGSLLGGSFVVAGTTSITNADTAAIQVFTTATNASFTFGGGSGGTTINDNAIGSGHNGNGIDLSTGIGNTNSFNFGQTLSVTTDAGFGVKVVSAAGANASTLTFGGGTNSIVATGGAAVDFTSANLSGATFATVTSANSAANGIQISGLLVGNFTANGGSITDAAGADVSITGGTTNITYNGTITDDVGTLVAVANKAAGTVDFNGAITDGNDGDGSGISLTNNTGAFIRFDGGLTLSTGANAAFTATGGGTVNVSGTANHITTTTGTALNVTGTTIGAGLAGEGGLNFHDISVNGAAKGIILNNAGTGGLTVTGTGTTDGTGGTIQNNWTRGVEIIGTSNISLKNMNFVNSSTTDAAVATDDNTALLNAAIYLNGANNVTLDNNNISGTNQQGIIAVTVNNLAVNNSTIDHAGNSSEEGAIKARELTGLVTLNNNDFSFSGGQTVEIKNTTGNLIVNADNTIMRDTQSSASGQGGFQAIAIGTTSVHPSIIVNLTNDQFLRLRTHGVNVQAVGTTDAGSASADVDITGSTFDPGTGTMIGIDLDADDASTLVFNINNNIKIDSRNGPAVNIFADVTASVIGRINNNPEIKVFDNPGFSQVGSAVRVNVNKSATGIIQIDNNHITNLGDDAGIDISDIGQTAANTGQKLQVSITNNVIALDASTTYGVFLLAASGAGEHNFLVANVENNTVTSPGIAAFRARVVDAGGTLQLQGFATDAGHTWDIRGNTPIGSTTFGGSGTFGAGTPALPSNPLPDADPLNAVSLGHSTDSIQLNDALLGTTVRAAIEHWIAAGLTANQVAALNGMQFFVTDLPGTELAETNPGYILIDKDAAGHGWFVDSTPNDNFEFQNINTSTELSASGGYAANHTDLLTVLMHELGHVLGLQHEPGNGLMADTLDDGIRRLPDFASITALDAGAVQPANAGAGHIIVGGFDSDYYLAHNPDVAAAGVDPLAHFETFGWHEGRNPNAYFDTAGYLAHYADVAAAGVNPLEHYEQFGWKEGRDPSAAFDTLGYFAANPDVAAANVNPMNHFLEYGSHEGRTAINDGLWHI